MTTYSYNRKTAAIAPVLNLNGTSAKSLMEEYRTALRALSNALDAVGSITVHGRDFQTADRNLYTKARDEQGARILAIHNIIEEIQEIEEQVADQEDARRKR